MKKIYHVLLAGLLSTQVSQAQLTLTKAANEPAPGDVNTTQDFDTTTVLPRSVGTSQTWDFSTLVISSNPASALSYSAASAVSASSLFPGTTVVEGDGSGSYTFYKSGASQLEMLGTYDPGPPANVMTFTNTLIEMSWPIAYGNSFTDIFSGSDNSSPPSTANGGQTVVATGSGTLKLPGGVQFSNVLQLKVTATFTENITSSTPTMNLVSTNVNYVYYHSSQKFPLLILSQNTLNQFAGTDISVSLNKAVVVGIKENSLDPSELSIFPNPAKNSVNLRLSNVKSESCTIEFFSVTGQKVKTVSPATSSFINENIPLNDLSAGLYLVKTSLGDRSSTRRLVVE